MLAHPDLRAPDQPRNRGASVTRFAFVGERRSRRAIDLGVYWENGRLAAKTLHAALRAAGLEPEAHVYLNLFGDDAEAPSEAALEALRALVAEGVTVVGMGDVVQKVLERAGLPHLRLIYPAARGAIRSRAVYQAHVAMVLGQEHPAQAPAAAA